MPYDCSTAPAAESGHFEEDFQRWCELSQPANLNTASPSTPVQISDTPLPSQSGTPWITDETLGRVGCPIGSFQDYGWNPRLSSPYLFGGTPSCRQSLEATAAFKMPHLNFITETAIAPDQSSVIAAALPNPFKDNVGPSSYMPFLEEPQADLQNASSSMISYAGQDRLEYALETHVQPGYGDPSCAGIFGDVDGIYGPGVNSYHDIAATHAVGTAAYDGINAEIDPFISDQQTYFMLPTSDDVAPLADHEIAPTAYSGSAGLTYAQQDSHSWSVSEQNGEEQHASQKGEPSQPSQTLPDYR